MDTYHISWQAPEYEHHEHGADWFWAVGIITVSLAVAFFIIGNILLALILLIGIGILLAHAKRKPQNVTYEISRKGIRAHATLYKWNSLESFWILEEHATEKKYIGPKLLLTSQKQFMPHIVIPLDNAPLEEIHHLLSRMLHEIPQMEPFPHRIMRKLGF